MLPFASSPEQVLVQNVSIENEFVWYENESAGETFKYVIACFRRKTRFDNEAKASIISWAKVNLEMAYCFYHSKIKLISSRRRVIISVQLPAKCSDRVQVDIAFFVFDGCVVLINSPSHSRDFPGTAKNQKQNIGRSRPDIKMAVPVSPRSHQRHNNISITTYEGLYVVMLTGWTS